MAASTVSGAAPMNSTIGLARRMPGTVSAPAASSASITDWAETSSADARSPWPLNLATSAVEPTLSATNMASMMNLGCVVRPTAEMA